MKKYSGILLIIFFFVPFLLAMGVMGKPPALEKAPEPKERLDAVVVDMEGLSTHVSHLSYDGELYLPAYRGKALITLPFKEIAKIEFGQKSQSRRKAIVHFRNHEPEEYALDESIAFVGKLPVGTYQIQVKDMASIMFLSPKDPDTIGGKGLEE